MSASEQESAEFAAAFRSFLEWVHQPGAGVEGNPVVALVRDHLGASGLAESVVSRELAPFEHVNLQTALDAWSARPGRTVSVRGVSVPPNYGGLSLQQLVAGEHLPPVRLSPPELVDLPSGPRGKTLACVQTAVLLVDDDAGRYVVMVRGPDPHTSPSIAVEVAGLPVRAAQGLHADLARLRSELNVYRGHVIELSAGQQGDLTVSFADLPRTEREHVVLPEAVLRRIERHTVGVATHGEQLLAAGQHLKRGVLLFGPPGTGKTHTTRYVVGRLQDCTPARTVVLLSGRALHLIGTLTDLARELAPTALVLEDVDLVAEDRGYHPGGSPVLFELLDAMDGAAADADLLFLLTTNRADLLEPALAARPGRVDVAVEIGLPDDDGRRRLLALYGRGVPLALEPADVDRVVERTAGTTASFLKELLRRAVLESLTEASPLRAVTAAHVDAALDDLLDSSQTITRALLGAGPTAPAEPGRLGQPAEPGLSSGWVAYSGSYEAP